MAYKITDECIACGSCMDECPVEAISEGDIYVIDAATCTDQKFLRRTMSSRSNCSGLVRSIKKRHLPEFSGGCL